MPIIETDFCRFIASSADREEWLAARMRGVGASECATVMGENPWESVLRLYLLKTGEIAEPDLSGVERVLRGTQLEPVVAEVMFAEETGRRVVRCGELYAAASAPFILATPDYFQPDAYDEHGGPGTLQIKTTGSDHYWRDGLIPPWIVWQVQQELAVTGLNWGSVAVLIAGQRFLWCDFKRDEEKIGRLIGAVTEFWGRVERREPPEDYRAGNAERSIAFPVDADAGAIALPGELIDVDDYLQLTKQNIAGLLREKDEAEGRIKAALGVAEVGVLPNGVTYTYKANKNGQRTTLRRKE